MIHPYMAAFIASLFCFALGFATCEKFVKHDTHLLSSFISDIRNTIAVSRSPKEAITSILALCDYYCDRISKFN